MIDSTSKALFELYGKMMDDKGYIFSDFKFFIGYADGAYKLICDVGEPRVDKYVNMAENGPEIVEKYEDAQKYDSVNLALSTFYTNISDPENWRDTFIGITCELHNVHETDNMVAVVHPVILSDAMHGLDLMALHYKKVDKD